MILEDTSLIRHCFVCGCDREMEFAVFYNHFDVVSEEFSLEAQLKCPVCQSNFATEMIEVSFD